MMSNLTAVRRELETRKPATGATCSLFRSKSIHFLYKIYIGVSASIMGHVNVMRSLQ